MTRKIFFLFVAVLSVAFVFTSCKTSANEPDNVTEEPTFEDQVLIAKGNCSGLRSNVEWVLYSDDNIYAEGTLYIYGEGRMCDFSSNHTTWTKYEAQRFKITKVIIGEGITLIGNFAFSSLENIKEVVLPNSLESIGLSAFLGCLSLSSITLPNSLTTIETSAFAGCVSLSSITFPSSLITIDKSAFHGSGLETLVIPDNIQSIGSQAFAYCKNLTSVEIGNSIKKIENSTFSDCENLKTISLGNSMWSIGDYAFARCNLTSITCHTPTPPMLSYSSFGATVFFNTITVYVPAESVDEYKNNENWKKFNIQPISVSN